MKRVFLVLLAMLLALSMVLTSCDNSGDTPTKSTTPKADPNPDPDPDPDPEPYTASTRYMPEEFAAEFKDIFEKKTSSSSFAALSLSSAPFSPADLFNISNCTVTSITIPVYKTLSADADGNFKFTIYVVYNSFKGMKISAVSKHEISINASDYDLEEKSNVCKYIDVDLSEYGIVLAENQSLAFCDKTDTIVPAYVLTREASPAADKLEEDFQVTCMFENVTTTSLSYSRNSLFFDFTFENTYESEEAYDAFVEAQEEAEDEYDKMVRAVRSYYGNKYLSLLGDSISTFDGITNNTQYSASLSKHRCFYWLKMIPKYELTYWGRLQTDTNMKLCVINSWSSSRVYGGGQDENDKKVTNDNILVRSSELHNKAGNSPDLVIIYMGINDTNNSPSSTKNDSSSSLYTRNKPAGDLYLRLVDRNKTKTDYEIVDEWFKEVKQIAANAGDTIVPGKTYNTWEAAYALAIENILTKYNNPDVFCMTLIPTIHANAEEKLVGRANVCIRAIANYFGVGIIDQDNSEIDLTNCHVYGYDEGTKVNSLHLNIRGHEMTTRLIVRTLYEHIQKQKN